MSENALAKTEDLEPKGQAIVTVDADLEDIYSEGESFGSEDLTIPFLRIAQKLSPQVDPEAAEFIPGLEPGMIFNTATGQFWSKEEGVPIIVSAARRELTEWVPRGSGNGGLVANHGTDLSPLAASDNTKDDKGRIINKDGNHLVEAMQYYVLQPDLESGMADPAVISMSSSNFKPARDLNLMMSTAKVQKSDGTFVKKPSPFIFVYRLTTAKRQNDDGTWYVFKPQQFCLTQEIPGGKELVLQAHEFRKMVLEGGVSADHETAGADADQEAEMPF
jgi:hypothetical protein